MRKVWKALMLLVAAFNGVTGVLFIFGVLDLPHWWVGWGFVLWSLHVLSAEWTGIRCGGK